MKRLLSWLLVLVMVFGLLPMSAFAVEVETENGDDDFELGMDELLPGYSAENPITPDWVWNDAHTEATASVEVPAGVTMYFETSRIATMYMTINDGEAVLCGGDNWNPHTWTITNDGDAVATYAMKIYYPLGHQMNPEVVETLSWTYTECTVPAGNAGVYYWYTYTAPAAGTVTFYFSEVPSVTTSETTTDDEGNETTTETTVKYNCDISITNNNTYENKILSVDGVDNYGLEVTMDVNAGDVLSINVYCVDDGAGAAAPAATMTWCGNFTYPAGSEQNPIALEWAWNDAYTDATASATVAAGETVYYYGQDGMILTVDGVETAQTEGVFSITNSGDAEATYALALATPVGAQANPEVIENIDGYTSEKHLDVDGAYYYIWTATEDGTVTLDVTDGANIVVDHITGVSEEGWPISVQSQLAEPETDENYNYVGWTVAENLVIEVKAGEQLKIQVNALTDWSTWTTPAIDYTLSGDFEAAVVAPEYVVTASGITLDMASELFIQSKFLIPDELYADENATVTIEFKGDVTEYNLVELKNELGLDSKGRLAIKQPIPAPYMDKMLTITIADGDGNVADFVSGDVSYEGSYSYGIETYADAICNVASMKNVMDAIAALLTYGSVAQEMFSNLPNVSSEPASNLLTKYGYEPVDLSQFSVADATQTLVNSGDDFGVSLRGGTPALDAAVYMTVQFNYDQTVALENLSFVVKYYEAASGKNYEVPVEASLNSKGRIEVKIENIAAALFDCIYTVEVTNNLTGEVYSGQYSVYEYIRATVAALDGNASQATTVNMAKAMYFYNQAANALFE